MPMNSEITRTSNVSTPPGVLWSLALFLDLLLTALILIEPTVRGAESTSAVKPAASSQLRLPCGPPGPGRFGAYWTKLSYEPSWDKPWRIGDYADVVIRFDQFEHRFVFWRGTSYVPCWATPEGPWFSNEYFERPGGKVSRTTSMVEPMSDKKTRYSHVRVIENTEARVVIQWRYAPTDLEYTLAFVDEQTGWGDWADEFYTIYPDSVGVRKATLYTSALNEWIEYQESIVVNQPGAGPEDSLNLTALTLANLKGESKDYTWTERDSPDLSKPPEDTCIQLVNLKSKFKPFTIFNPEGATVSSYGGHAPGSHFNFWNHWPVAQEKSDTSVAKSADRPSHTSLSHLKWKPYAQDEKSQTWIHLHGMTDQPAAKLGMLGKSWLFPPDLKVSRGGFSSQGYDPTQRAYLLQNEQPGQPSTLEIELTASPEQPVVNLCLVIRNWGPAAAKLKLNGQSLPRGKDFRFGYRDSLEGRDLIVWIRAEATSALRLTLSPVTNKVQTGFN